MKVLLLICRFFLGVVFLMAGLNGYFVILDLEPFIETSPAAMALFQFDYLLIIEKSLEILCGILLLANRFIPLVLAILSPIVANIFLLHVFVDHSLLSLAICIMIAYSYMLFYFRENFVSIFEKKPS
ncbi:DoxX family membrane protein [Salinibacillus xinjiangensis]|uniref:DoxX family membrane protein n=1 Tax=Salinibacillus xinjiangensis TaxID=1229268 RepID=UPI002B279ECC|nr:DoxX family membrane protein [Salinibacillus xinjiangensis]